MRQGVGRYHQRGITAIMIFGKVYNPGDITTGYDALRRNS